MGICEVLTVIFIVCKILGKLNWSWWLVFLPEIIAIIFYILMFLGVGIFIFKSNKS